ncbi:MAG: hypothetical protein JO314_02745 [Acidobacteria bacterium]|nr:hypothetical protein [Acidobacteriota bacterium]
MTPEITFNRGAISAGECVGQGWEAIKPNYWIFFVMVLIFIVGSAALSCIPFVGGLGFQIAVAPALTVGIYQALFRQMRNEPVDIGMMFRGFEKFRVVVIVGLIQSIPTIIWTVLSLVLNVGSTILQSIDPKLGKGYSSNLAAGNDAAPVIAGGILIVVFIGLIIGLIFAIAWGITFLFAYPILAEHDVSAIDAIKLSAAAGWGNAGGLIVLFIVQFLLALVGVLALCVGVFFVVPVIYASTAVAYRMVFPPQAKADPFNYNPPDPATYRDWGPGGMAA